MSKFVFVCTGPITESAVESLRHYGDVIIAPEFTNQAVSTRLHHADALIVRGVESRVDADLMDRSTKLKVIARTGSGYDNVDIAAATARGIPVVYAPGANARAVAEGSLAMMLALCKRISYFDRQLKRGNWNSRFDACPEDISGRNLGIIGFGRIGRALAVLAKSLEMNVVAFDPYADETHALQLRVDLVDLDGLLTTSDFIAIHASQTKETIGIINSARMSLLKPGAYLVNLARGGLIADLDCLYEALQDGRLAGVGLDVFDPEPPDVSHPIFQHPNCLATPHALALTPGAMEAICQSVVHDTLAILHKLPPRFVVNHADIGLEIEKSIS